MAPHVCIVGAGISGLRCAAVLLENSFDVTIIEARNRVGGRARVALPCVVAADTDSSSDSTKRPNGEFRSGYVSICSLYLLRVKLIAAAAAGPTGSIGLSTELNPIVELAKETGTPLHLWKESTLLIDGTGRCIDVNDANTALRRVWDILEKAIKFSGSKTKDLSPSTSLYDFFTTECDEMVHKGDIGDYESELVLGMAQMWGAYVGERVERQSLKFLFLEDCIHGDDCFVPTNYKNIIAKAASVPLTRAKLRLGTVMKSVRASNSERGKVCISTLEGKEEYFDDVVITTPLGWLKKNKQAIQPLYPRISEAIDTISFGRLEKVLIEFPSAFWEVTQSSAGERQEGSISFVHWLSPSYAPTTNPHGWKLECVSFNALPEPYRRNILLFYTFGDCSTHITTLVHGLEGSARAKVLQEYFEPYYSRLPNYNPQTCAPVRFLATEWSQDEFAGYGSYCNFQVGMTDAAHDVEAIRHGMPEQHIYFAGEHTAPFDGLGTVAGAYSSGEAVARRIVGSAKTSD